MFSYIWKRSPWLLCDQDCRGQGKTEKLIRKVSQLSAKEMSGLRYTRVIHVGGGSDGKMGSRWIVKALPWSHAMDLGKGGRKREPMTSPRPWSEKQEEWRWALHRGHCVVHPQGCFPTAGHDKGAVCPCGGPRGQHWKRVWKCPEMDKMRSGRFGKGWFYGNTTGLKCFSFKIV